jgi:hypothetical protein
VNQGKSILALANYSKPQSDTFRLQTDGTGLARLTDDAARDWEPRFVPAADALRVATGAQQAIHQDDLMD